MRVEKVLINQRFTGVDLLKFCFTYKEVLVVYPGRQGGGKSAGGKKSMQYDNLGQREETWDKKKTPVQTTRFVLGRAKKKHREMARVKTNTARVKEEY